MMEKFALLAGNGDLPKQIIHALKERGSPLIVVCFEGMTQAETFQDHDVFWVSIGHIGLLLKTLKDHHVTHIVMAGQIPRPSLKELSLDWLGTKWLARVGMKAFGGDDALLSTLTELIEKEGFQVIAPHQILSNTTVASGVLTKISPNTMATADIQRGRAILDALSPFDVGQAIVVQEGIVIGIEAAEGTEALLARAKTLRKQSADGGVLVKIAKKGQSLLVDVPTIGPETVMQVARANLSGIAMSAHTTQIIDKEKVVDLCNHHHLFLVAMND